MDIPQTPGGVIGTILGFLILLGTAIKVLPVIGRAFTSGVRVTADAIVASARAPRRIAVMVDRMETLPASLEQLKVGNAEATRAAHEATQAAHDAHDEWRHAAPAFGGRLGDAERQLIEHTKRLDGIDSRLAGDIEERLRKLEIDRP